MSHIPWKLTRQAKKQENMTCDEKNKINQIKLTRTDKNDGIRRQGY